MQVMQSNKAKVVGILIFGVLLLLGCSTMKYVKGQAIGTKGSISILHGSDIDPKNCLLCGTGNRALFSMYKGQKNIGIINLNTFDFSPVEINRYDDAGNLIEKASDSTTLTSNNYGGLCTDVSPNPDRGYANVDIRFEQKEILDTEKVKKNLCAACFNTIIDRSWSDNPYSIGIIDFDTLEVRLLEECVTAFLFGDFYITCNHEIRESEDEKIKLNLFVFYCPERYQ